MCGLTASSVREELVSGAVREAEHDFVYGEIKPLACSGVGFSAAPGAQACFHLPSAGSEAPVGQGTSRLPDEGEEELGTKALCNMLCVPHPGLACSLPTAWPRCAHPLVHPLDVSWAPTDPGPLRGWRFKEK